MTCRVRRLAVCLAPMVLLCLPAQAPAKGAVKTIRITTLSNRADLISDGQALVAIRLPRGARHLRVRLGRRRVTRSFRRRSNGRIEGVVRGLRRGRNRLVARAHGARGARLTITNYPNGGPVFSGPQVQPWRCQATATDAQCNQPASFDYLYKSTDRSKSGLQPYDPKNPPGDVATAITDEGRRVPFVVRREVGYQNRDQYVILVLYSPGKPWSRWRPQRQWNRKLLVPGGGGCGVGYGAGSAPLEDYSGTLPPNPAAESSYITALGRGFAVLSTALANTGHNCALATAAESLIMAKERLIENYGGVRYTIGTGCSGGSVVQMTVANAYPRGVYDGLVITCSFPDVLTAGAQFADYNMLRRYFETPATLALWPPAQWGLVYGRPDPVNAIVADEVFFKSATNPAGTCVPPDKVYNPQTNPRGARCSVLDYMVNMLGRRPREVWTDMERRAGRGFAGQPFGNSGVEYGRDALNRGLITPAQFVDLNAKIGGSDIDLKPTAGRLEGDDRAVANAYRTGAVNEMTNMSGVAIINHAGPDPGIAHDSARAWWIRDRLDRAQGNHSNAVLWFGPFPLIGDPNWARDAFLAMDRWLTAVEKDRSRAPRARKIVTNRPADVQDRCTANICNSPAATRYGTPRQVAGASRLNDIVKCRLKPLARGDYKVPFTSEQWSRLQKAFPRGVCDWTQPGVGQQRNRAWLTYQDRKGHVIYGGRPMGRAPRSIRLR